MTKTVLQLIMTAICKHQLDIDPSRARTSIHHYSTCWCYSILHHFPITATPNRLVPSRIHQITVALTTSQPCLSRPFRILRFSNLITLHQDKWGTDCRDVGLLVCERSFIEFRPPSHVSFPQFSATFVTFGLGVAPSTVRRQPLTARQINLSAS